MKTARIFNKDLLNRNELMTSLRGKRAHAFPQMAEKKLVITLLNKIKI